LIESKHEQLKKIDELNGQVIFVKKQLDDKNKLLSSSSGNFKKMHNGIGEMLNLSKFNQPDYEKEKEQIEENTKLQGELLALKKERNQFDDKILTHEFELKRVQQHVVD